jgi:hypothetical protein
MKESTALPDLRMVATPDLIPHEDFDPKRVESLAKRIWQSGVLKHPPIVTAIPGSDQFVVLDGANRSTAFAYLGIPHMVVQHISYGDPGIDLETWHHVVSGMPLNEFEEALAEMPGLGLVACDLEEAREALSLEKAGAYIVCQDGVRVMAKTQKASDHIAMLVKIVSAYKGKADIYRASNDVWEKQAPYYPRMIALVVFPKLTPADILAAAQNGVKLPSGITRHIVPNRAVNINIPLHLLTSSWALERKREWLHNWFMEKMAENAIRFYSESTFSFDE